MLRWFPCKWFWESIFSNPVTVCFRHVRMSVGADVFLLHFLRQTRIEVVINLSKFILGCVNNSMSHHIHQNPRPPLRGGALVNFWMFQGPRFGLQFSPKSKSPTRQEGKWYWRNNMNTHPATDNPRTLLFIEWAPPLSLYGLPIWPPSRIDSLPEHTPL